MLRRWTCGQGAALFTSPPAGRVERYHVALLREVSSIGVLSGLVWGEGARIVEDGQAGVRVVLDADLGPDVVQPGRRRRDLRDEAVEAHGVVVADGALLLGTEDVPPLLGSDGGEGRARLLGRRREAGVAIGDEGLGEEAVGRGAGGDVAQGELLG